MSLDYKGGVVANVGRLPNSNAGALDAQSKHHEQRPLLRKPGVVETRFRATDTYVSVRDMTLRAASAVRCDRRLVPAWTVDVHRPVDDKYWVWNTAFALAPNNTIVTVGGDHRVETWDVRTGRSRGAFTADGLDNYGMKVAVSRGGVIATDGLIQHNSGAHYSFAVLWDARGASLGRSEVGLSMPGASVELAWMPDGRLVTGGYGGELKIWDPIKHLHSIPAHTCYTGAIAVHANGTIAAGSDAGAVCFWDGSTYERKAPVIEHGAAILALRFGPEEQVFTAGGNVAKLWDAGGKLLRATDDEGVKLMSGAIASDGTMLTGGDDGLKVWDTNGKRTQHLPEAGRVHRIVIGPKGTLVTASLDGKLMRWGNP